MREVPRHSEADAASQVAFRVKTRPYATLAGRDIKRTQTATAVVTLG